MPTDASTDATVLLRLDEADELAAAWVCALAERRGIRALLIKGPALHLHGLREERVSADVDLLVEPARFEELCEAIVGSGWRERPSLLISKLTTVHSKTYLRDGWPCDLDVHSFYPGFLADPADVFEALWRHRWVLSLAHRDCLALDKTAGALVLALHSLRGATIQPRHLDELEQLVRAPFTDDERAELAALARETGCVATLESVLPRLGVEVEPTAAERAAPELRYWRERVTAGSHGSYFWMLALRKSRWRDRPRLLWRAFWPTRRDLLVARPEAVDTIRGRTRARLARWGRGIRSAPAGARAVWTHRRGVSP
ncbi:nucleotidyltransferase family protein [Microbacterium sp. NPDC058062]|uniref:nucleotidyltransferase family protein n=1 Tax=Microbacterium sp. NPDC058062 TaxID=3346320 RepID=UPI0036DE1E7C